MNFRSRLLAASSACALTAYAASSAFALPVGESVVSGSATVSRNDAYTDMTVDQSTSSAVINWQKFDIANGESVTFNQPSSSALAVNRVTGSTSPSYIYGALSANGRVVVVNQNGLLFGSSANVNVNSLLASTVDIDLAGSDLANGIVKMQGTSNAAASVVNEGSITAGNGGVVALVGAGVANHGTITATAGKVSLAATRKYTLDFNGDGLVKFLVNASLGGAEVSTTPVDAAGNALPAHLWISKDGKIINDGGTVQMTATTAAGALDQVINMEGLIQARSLSSAEKGKVLLHAGAPTDGVTMGTVRGRVKIDGTIDTARTGGATTDGEIRVMGEYIDILGNSVIDAGATNGVLHVGGNEYDLHLDSGALDDNGEPINSKLRFANDLNAPWAARTYIAWQANLVAGSGSKSVTGLIVYEEGNIPLIMSSGHDGKIIMHEITDRCSGSGCECPGCVLGADNNASLVAHALADKLFAQTGGKMHKITANIARLEIDMNRDASPGASDRLEAFRSEEHAKGADSWAYKAYWAYHDSIDEARDKVTADFGKGYFFDVHGYADNKDPDLYPTGTSSYSSPSTSQIEDIHASPDIILGYGDLTPTDLKNLYLQNGAALNRALDRSSVSAAISAAGGDDAAAFEYLFGAKSLGYYIQQQTDVANGRIYNATPGPAVGNDCLNSPGDAAQCTKVAYPEAWKDWLEADSSRSLSDPPPNELNVNHYFRGDHTTDSHTSMAGGTIDGVQMEIPTWLRTQVKNGDLSFPEALATAFTSFMDASYGFDLNTVHGSASGAAPVAPTPSATAAPAWLVAGYSVGSGSGSGSGSSTGGTSADATTTTATVTDPVVDFDFTAPIEQSAATGDAELGIDPRFAAAIAPLLAAGANGADLVEFKMARVRAGGEVVTTGLVPVPDASSGSDKDASTVAAALVEAVGTEPASIEGGLGAIGDCVAAGSSGEAEVDPALCAARTIVIR